MNQYSYVSGAMLLLESSNPVTVVNFICFEPSLRCLAIIMNRINAVTYVKMESNQALIRFPALATFLQSICLTPDRVSHR